MTVKIDEHTAYEPDLQVHCGEPLTDEQIIVPTPVIAGRSPVAQHFATRGHRQAR